MPKIITKSRIVLICLSAFVAGIGASSFLPGKILPPALYAAASTCAVFFIAVRFTRLRAYSAILLTILFFFLGVSRYAVSLPPSGPSTIAYYNGQKVELAGRVANYPDLRGADQKFMLDDIRLGGSLRKVSGKVLVTSGRFTDFAKGDRLSLACKLKEPGSIDGFDYGRFLAKDGVYSLCYKPSIIKQVRRQDRRLPAFNALRDTARQIIESGLIEPEAGLASALTLGTSHAVSENLNRSFSSSGLAHIVSISGMHISILAGLVMYALVTIGCWRRTASVIAACLLAAYIALIGFQPAAVRSLIMGLLLLFALGTGRINSMPRALLVAAAVMLAINPKLFRDDVGFQLSFLATAGIGFFFAPLRDFLAKKRLVRALPETLRDSFALTLAAQALAVPVVAYDFQSVSLISPVSNLVVAWCMPFLLVAIIAAVVLAFAFPAVQTAVFFPAYLLLRFVIITAEWASRVPFAAVTLGKGRFFPFLAFYLALAAVLLVLAKFGMRRRGQFQSVPSAVTVFETALSQNEIDRIAESGKGLNSG